MTGVLVFTFDDGYRNTHELSFPILKQHGLAATAFIITGLVHPKNWNGKPTMTWQQIHELYDAGWDIESHCVTHLWLKSLSLEEKQFELKQSKDTLKEQGFDPVGLSYPFGDWGSSDRPIPEVVKQNYKWGRCVTDIEYMDASKDRYFIPAVQMPNKDYTMEEAKKAVDGAIELKKALVLILHRVLPEKDSLVTSVADLANFCDYVHKKVEVGELRCLTLRKLMDELK